MRGPLGSVAASRRDPEGHESRGSMQGGVLAPAVGLHGALASSQPTGLQAQLHHDTRCFNSRRQSCGSERKTEHS